MEKERRQVARYPFVANAELVDERSNMRIQARVSELSLSGCYVDMLNALPVGMVVLVKISAGADSFQAMAEILHSQTHLGVGVRFIDVEPNYRPVLQAWIEKAEKDQQGRPG